MLYKSNRGTRRASWRRRHLSQALKLDDTMWRNGKGRTHWVWGRAWAGPRDMRWGTETPPRPDPRAALGSVPILQTRRVRLRETGRVDDRPGTWEPQQVGVPWWGPAHLR